MAEMIKNIHVFLIKAANGLMPSHPGPPTANIWWLNSNSLWTRHVQQNKNGALMQSLLIKPPEVRHCRKAYIWRLTSDCRNSHSSLLLSVMHVNHIHFSAMQADTSKKVTVTWLLRCKQYMVIASSRAGQIQVWSLFCRPNVHALGINNSCRYKN